jgi:hypothetical protein
MRRPGEDGRVMTVVGVVLAVVLVAVLLLLDLLCWWRGC